MANATCKVLIVEDDLDDVVLLRRALKTASTALGVSFEIVHVRNGLDALASVARGDLLLKLPSVIVVDLNMPIMSGEAFLSLLRGELLLRALPTVVLTTATEKPIHDAAMMAGADHVFVKPNTLSELVIVARTILEMGRSPPRGAIQPNAVAAR